MSKSAFSLLVFSIYMFVLGSIIVIVPNLLLSIFGFPQTHEVWIRVMGMFILIIGYFYFMASRSDLRTVFRLSVSARLAVPVFFIVFVVLGLAPPILIIFGAIDASAALWTAACLRDDALAQANPQADRSLR